MPTPRVKTTKDVRGAEAAIQEAASIVAGPRPGKVDAVTLSSGIVIKLRNVPPFALQDIARQLVPPAPPIWHNEAKDRDEENPDDPDYQIELLAFKQHQLLTVSMVLLTMGTKFGSAPDDCEGPDGEEWLTLLKAAGMTIDPQTATERYIAWLRYYALASKEDIQAVMTPLLARTGVQEVEVAQAVAAFRSAAGRSGDRGRADSDEGADGD